jgi:hypothetical protein
VTEEQLQQRIDNLEHRVQKHARAKAHWEAERANLQDKILALKVLNEDMHRRLMERL